MTAAVVTLGGVSYAYRALPVLHQLDWQFPADQQWACVGPNGAGKTTLAGILSGQLHTSCGELRFGTGISRIGYVCFEQQQALCARDRQRDDSEFRSDAQDPGTTVERAILGTRQPDSRFEYWTGRLQLGRHLLGRGIRFISTGEMRKTLLLRAILAQPQLLILDNPLDGLDLASQREMDRILQELLQSELKLLLLCRQLEDIPAGVSHLLVLDGGRKLCEGPRRQVLARRQVQALMNPPARTLGQVPAAAHRPYRIDRSLPLLELRQVDVSYGEVEVLRKLDWVLRPGQHCHISGPNGCGKSTLLSLINGDNHKAYGQDITLFGQLRGSGESVWQIKQKYGLVDTHVHLAHARGMKVIEVVVSGFFDSLGLYDDWGDQQHHCARQWLRALGLEELERQPFDALSFGMQRMVLLARAMVKSPIMLILDEPCLGLDGYHRRSILAALEHIARHCDTHLIYVSHCAGEMPACINQRLEFVADGNGFTAVTHERVG